LLTIFAFGTGQANPPQRTYEQAWSAIMADLEAVIRSQAEHGPYIDTTPEEMGLAEGHHIFEAIQEARRQHPEYRNSLELDRYENLQKILVWQGNLDGEYQYKDEAQYKKDRAQKKILRKERQLVLMNQFQKSFKRELSHLSSTEAGKLMAHFTSLVPFHGPSFMTPLVFFAWSSQSEVYHEIHKMAQEMIWETGNPDGLRTFVPHLLTNRTATYADFDKTKADMDFSHQPLLSSSLEGWLQRYPQETLQALQDFEWAVVWGDLRKPSLFNLPELRGLWSATPVPEVYSILQYEKKKGRFHSKPSSVSCIRAHRS
jgi:hypothetical protein